MNRVPMTWQNSMSEGFRSVTNKIKNWFGRWFGKEEVAPTEWMPNRLFSVGRSTDVEETAKEVIVRTPMPKLNKNDFTLEVSLNQLIIRGEQRHHSEHQGKNFHRMEW